MVKPSFLAQCLLLPSIVLAQGQVTIRIPTCDPGLGTTGSISGEPAGATGLAPGSSGGSSAPGGGSVPGGGSGGSAPGGGSASGVGSASGGSVGSGIGSGVAPGAGGSGPSS